MKRFFSLRNLLSYEPFDSEVASDVPVCAWNRRTAKAWWLSLRPKQWTKNLFVLTPLIFSCRLFSASAATHAFFAAFLFCLTASSSYLINDIRDQEQDRLHPEKKLRPVAAGMLPIANALALGSALLILSLVGGILLKPAVAGVLAFYWILNLAYSLKLKNVAGLDAVLVAAGFILRLSAGAAAIDVVTSHWLLLCTGWLALFLVLGKRKSELAVLGEQAYRHRKALYYYGAHVLNFAIVAAAAAAFVSYLLYTLLQTIHPRSLVWTSVFVMAGICRYLYLLFGKGQGEDPSLVLLNDIQIRVYLFLWAVVVIRVIYL
jgi:4-hydroxybenzoate polyprenyltransferase